MANIRHHECAIRTLAKQAKNRLRNSDYKADAPRGLTPAQQQLYARLEGLIARGEEVVNPIKQLADTEAVAGMTHEERQSYVIRLAADYLALKSEVEARAALRQA